MQNERKQNDTFVAVQSQGKQLNPISSNGSIYHVRPHPENTFINIKNYNVQLKGKYFCKSGICYNISITCLKAKECKNNGKDTKCLGNQNYQDTMEYSSNNSKINNSTHCTAELSPINISIEKLLVNTRTSLFVLNAKKNEFNQNLNNSAGNEAGVIVIASSLPAVELAKVADEIRAFLMSETGSLTLTSKSGKKTTAKTGNLKQGLGKPVASRVWVQEASVAGANQGKNVSVGNWIPLAGSRVNGLKMPLQLTQLFPHPSTLNSSKTDSQKGKLIIQNMQKKLPQ